MIQKMINFDDVTKENIKEYNPNWPQIPDHPYRILIIGGCGSGKTNSLFNLINQQPDIGKIYLCAKEPYKAKKWKSAGPKHLNDSKAFFEYLNNIDNIYKNIEEYSPNKKCKMVIVFDDMIATMLSNKNLNSIVTELYIRVGRLNISLFYHAIIL